MWQQNLKEQILQEIEAGRRENPAFSLRSFARHVQVSPGALSEFLRNRRKLSPPTALRILRRMNLDETVRERLLHAIRLDEKLERVPLTPEQFGKISHWSTAALMCLFEFDRPPADLDELARKLGLETAAVEKKLADLKEIGLLHVDGEGRTRASGLSYTTSQDVPTEDLRRFQQESMALGTKALENLPPDKREVTSVIFSSNRQSLELAKNEIRKFRDRLANLMGGAGRDEVYQMQISFFPLTDWSGDRP